MGANDGGDGSERRMEWGPHRRGVEEGAGEGEPVK